MDVFDLTIIGSGPTGLFAAFYAGMREMKTKVIESLPEPGGQLATLYPEKFIYDSPGYSKILAKNLVKNLLDQTSRFNPTLLFNERALSIDRPRGDIIKVETDKNVHVTKNLLITAGIGAFSPNKLNSPGVEKFEGNGVFYHVKNKDDFRGKRILIVGGGDTALDWALFFENWSKEVVIIHRRDVFRAHESSVKEIFSSGIVIKLFWELKELHGDKSIEGATILNSKTKEEQYLSIDSVLISIGFKADLGPIKTWGLDIEGRSIKVNGNMETNMNGVFAAGDVAKQNDVVKLGLIATGFAQAAVAVAVAKKRLDPVAPLFEHSSDKNF